ncbi:MAG TPA: hypothetical protein VFG87_11740 [Amycolatopsis sp.]|jgi:hypothetical protein|nr:hypothetical protein [Amycolatopsis sp.]
MSDLTPVPLRKRTCPWCGDARVYAFGEEAVRRALANHLRDCAGPAEVPDERSA